MRIALACARSADRASRGKLAASTTILIRVVADSGTFEFTGRSVTASVVATGGGAAAVAVFTILDNAITALLTCDGRDALIVNEGGGVDAIAAESGTDVTN